MSTPEGGEDASYLIKRVSFFGREVPVFLQNLNGPCPLLAIANVLSLRNELKLPSSEARRVSQSQLITLVAERLLEASAQYDDLSQFAADMRQNITDAFEALEKLTTGVDVNVKFHSIFAFEPTPEVAPFDLLGISLVHGWLVDPEGEAVIADLFGARSYNELVELLFAELGSEGTSRLPSTASSHHLRGASFASAGSAAWLQGAAALPSGANAGGAAPAVAAAAASSSAAAPGPPADAAAAAGACAGPSAQATPAAEAGAGGSHGGPVDAGGSAAAAAAAANAGPLTTAAADDVTSTAAGSDEDVIDALLQDIIVGLVSAAQPGPIPLGESPTRAASLQGMASREAAFHGVSRLSRHPRGAGSGGGGESDGGGRGDAGSGGDDGSDGGAVIVAAQPGVADGGAVGVAAPAPSSPGTRATVAAAVRAFLERHATQLTPHGLRQLAGGLREHQLAVFFRNNHFSTVFAFEGGVYLLVTDQGYATERDVVWERLDTVDGNTTFFTGSFTPFVAHADATAADAQLAAALVASAAEAAGSAGGALDAAAGTGGDAGADADFALALALQMQEEEEAAAEREWRRQQQEAAAAAGGQGGASASAPPAQQQVRQHERQQQQQGQLSPPQQQAADAGYRGGSRGEQRYQAQQQQQRAGPSGTARPLQRGLEPLQRGLEDVKEKCTIM